MNALESVQLLASSQQTVGGINLLVTTADASDPVVSFQYFVYPGSNITSSASIYNRTVNVGSDEVSKPADNMYSVFIDTALTVDNSDRYVVIRALFSDGSTSDYSSAVLLPLAPQAISEVTAALVRDAEYYSTTATIRAFFTEGPAPASGTITYNLGVQYVTDQGNTKFAVLTGLTYGEVLRNAVVGEITDAEGIDDAWVAVQVVRTLTDGETATSTLSNTTQALDTDTPLPPDTLTGTYDYEIQVVTLSWSPSNYEAIGEVASYKVYKDGVYLDKVDVTTTTPPAEYTFQDTNLSGSIGRDVEYYVTTVGHESNKSESGASNIVTFHIVKPSTVPNDVHVIGVSATNTAGTQDITVTFKNPDEVYHDGPSGTAYFQINVLDASGNQITDGSAMETYSSTATSYTVSFNDLAFTPIGSANTQDISVRVRLITSQNGEQLNGIPETKTATIGPKPLIYQVGGFSAPSWTTETLQNVEKYRVISATALHTNSITYLDSNIDDHIQIADVTVSSSTIGELNPFAGCFQYDVTVPSTDAGSIIVLKLSAANEYGTSSVTISGAISI